ncbi:hypothetical protein [Acidocella aminolytica]|uniref:hypothetical protein n=1 Tax=Acidocella aminolytica TaxID=33998 RepID=UPI001FD30F2E|nr:hypothetical protein [Acidocella aminolytica]
MTPRTASAPSLVDYLSDVPVNPGPVSISVTPPIPGNDELANAAQLPPNGLQAALGKAASRLPTSGADPATHIKRLQQAISALPEHKTAGDAGSDAAIHMRAFLGR